jgi:undecaprenyl-diphosphatase
LPGISRSGASIVAGLLLRMTHDDAARYSFLLATPVIVAASLLEIPKLFAPQAHGVLAQSAVGALVAALTAYASVAFLTRWFHSHDLRPFGWYCLIFGSLALALALAKVIS